MVDANCPARWPRLAEFVPASTLIFLFFWVALLLAGQQRLFRDPGTLWHTRIGLDVLSTGQLLDHDPFSFTCADVPWIPQQWLAEILMAVGYRLAGWDSLLVLTAALLAALYSWLASRLMRAGFHWLSALCLAALVLGASASHFHVRPHLSTLVGFGITCALLFDVESGRAPLGRLVWLIPLSLLWANLHGGILAGWMMLALAWGGWSLLGRLGRSSPLPSWRAVVGMGVVGIGCGLTVLVNPYGLRLPETWRHTMSMPALTQIIVEHGPLVWHQLDGLAVLVVAGVYLAVLAGLQRWPRLTWLLPLLWLYLAWGRVRHGPLFNLAAGLAMAEMFPHTRWASALRRRGSDLFVPPAAPTAPSNRRALVIPVVGVLLALGWQQLGQPLPLLGPGWARLDPETAPLQLAPTLQELPAGTRLFNEMNLGGFVIFFAPQVKIFVDDRCELYGELFLLDYVATDEQPQRIEAWARVYGFQLALVRRDSPLDRYLQENAQGWERRQETPTALLYRRKS